MPKTNELDKAIDALARKIDVLQAVLDELKKQRSNTPLRTRRAVTPKVEPKITQLA